MDSENPQSETKQPTSAQSTVPKVPLGKHTAAALRAEMGELQQLQTLLQTRMAAHSRVTTALIADAGFDPEKYQRYELHGDAMHLIGGE